MTALSRGALIVAAGAFIDTVFSRDESRGTADDFLKGVDDPYATRWNAAFVHYAGHLSQLDRRTGKSRWPLPATAECQALAAFAHSRNVLSSGAPRAGDVFLMWSPAEGRFVHTGIVVSALACDVNYREPARYECRTIEGNVTRTGCVGGDRVAVVRRTLQPGFGDRTVRWTEVEGFVGLG